jgi:hypothetical protein
MKLRDILKPFAPMLATAVGGPFAGLAVEAIGNALGVDQPTQDKIAKALSTGSLTGEQIVAVKSAEQAFTIRCRELDIDLAKLEVEDRKDARAMLTGTRARTPAYLSWLVVLGNFAVMAYLIRYGNPTGLDDVLLGRMLGTLDTAFGLVLAFWLGTSHSSRNKDETISSLSK